MARALGHRPMTSPSDDTLRRQLNAPDVAERDADFTDSLLDRVRRDRRRGIVLSLAWAGVLTGLVGLLAAGFSLGGAEAVFQAIAALKGS
jgi:hypothetical protein